MLTLGAYFLSKYKDLKYLQPQITNTINIKYEELEMAKSFIDQLLDLVGVKLPDAHGHYSPSVYRDEPSSKKPSDAGKHQAEKSPETAQATAELTGVARYLANNYPEEQKEAAQADTSGTAGLTGVAKYLAQKQQEEQEKAEAEAAALAKMTGVARYLAKQEGKITTAPAKTETAEPANTASLTRVEKYLAKQQITPSDISQPEEVQQAAPAKATEQKPVVEEKKTQPKQEVEKQSPPAAKTPGKIINLAEGASQCQAATSKGTQCRRKTGLETLEKTISHQKYKFAVCSQHNSKEFAPFAELLQKG
jgi:hypothetical protein